MLRSGRRVGEGEAYFLTFKLTPEAAKANFKPWVVETRLHHHAVLVLHGRGGAAAHDRGTGRDGRIIPVEVGEQLQVVDAAARFYLVIAPTSAIGETRKLHVVGLALVCESAASPACNRFPTATEPPLSLSVASGLSSAEATLRANPNVAIASQAIVVASPDSTSLPPFAEQFWPESRWSVSWLRALADSRRLQRQFGE